MSLFFRHATTAGAAWKPAAAPVKQKQRGTLAKALEVQCDEELLTLSQGPES
jgi:hypothetical protein